MEAQCNAASMRARLGSALCRVPEYFVACAGQLMRAKAKLQSLYNREPSEEELCSALGWSRLRLAKVSRAYAGSRLGLAQAGELR